MENLFHQSYFALFAIVGIGMVLGQIRIRGIALDVSAVILVALVFGHWGVTVPQDFGLLGLILFIYGVGLQAGPGFFEAFQREGRRLMIVAVAVVATAAVLTGVLAAWRGLDWRMAAGLMAGALTSTPGLAAAIEATGSPLASIGYGVAYPLGVVLVVLFVRFLPQALRIDVGQAAADYTAAMRAAHPALSNRNFVVENPVLDGQTVAASGVGRLTGARISRVAHAGVGVTPTPQTVLRQGDLIKAVGTEAALEKVEKLVGSPTTQTILLRAGYEVQWVLVTNKEVVNRTLAQLNLWALHNATVTRIRRSGIEIAPVAESALRFGDKLMVAADADNLRQVARLLGNDDHRLSETNFLPLALGILLGVLLGTVTVPVGIARVGLGTTGGVLLVALVLGRLGRTGPVLWTMSGMTNHLLRQLGLLLFLAAVGTEAGSHLAATVRREGLELLAMGMVITLAPMLVAVLLGRWWLRLNVLTLLGTLAGSQTCTPGLAAADQMTSSDAPAVAYATVYPVALVSVIVACQVLGRL